MHKKSGKKICKKDLLLLEWFSQLYKAYILVAGKMLKCVKNKLQILNKEVFGHMRTKGQGLFNKLSATDLLDPGNGRLETQQTRLSIM